MVVFVFYSLFILPDLIHLFGMYAQERISNHNNDYLPLQTIEAINILDS